jgi:hypothetical protein
MNYVQFDTRGFFGRHDPHVLGALIVAMNSGAGVFEIIQYRLAAYKPQSEIFYFDVGHIDGMVERLHTIVACGLHANVFCYPQGVYVDAPIEFMGSVNPSYVSPFIEAALSAWPIEKALRNVC